MILGAPLRPWHELKALEGEAGPAEVREVAPEGGARLGGEGALEEREGPGERASASPGALSPCALSPRARHRLSAPSPLSLPLTPHRQGRRAWEDDAVLRPKAALERVRGAAARHDEVLWRLIWPPLKGLRPPRPLPTEV